MRARAWIEPPDGWGPARLVLVELGRLGYVVTEWRVLGLPVYMLSG